MILAMRLVILAGALALVAFGLTRERHAVSPLGGGDARQVSGAGYTADAAVDGYVRVDGTLYDAYTPLTPGQVQLKDCKT